MVKVQQLPGGQLVVTIPKDVARLKSWKKGTNLTFIEDNFGNVMLKEAKG